MRPLHRPCFTRAASTTVNISYNVAQEERLTCLAPAPVKLRPYGVIKTHTYRLTALCPGLPGRAGTRKVKPIWILLKQETVSGSSISWAKCKSAPRSTQTSTATPHHSAFFTGRMAFLPPNQQRQSTEGTIWRYTNTFIINIIILRGFVECNCLQCFDTVGWAAGRASGL